jgi:hypothetical protein
LPELQGRSDEVSIEGNRFTVRQGQASLVGTFLQPADVQVTHARGKVAVRLIKDRRDETVHRELNAIHASGADATAGDFVVVLTLQKGPAPAVDMEGDGEVLRIGDRRVRILPGRLVWE